MTNGAIRVRLVGLTMLALGVIDLLSRIDPAPDGSKLGGLENALLPWLPDSILGATGLLGIVLIVLGRGLLQRRALAVPLSVAVLGLSVASKLNGGPTFMAALCGCLAVLIIRWRHLFVAGVPTGRGRLLARVAGTAVAFDFVYGFAGLLVGRLFTPIPPMPSAFGGVANALAGNTGSLSIDGAFGRWFTASLAVAGVLTVGVVLLVALNASPDESEAASREGLRRLADRPDGDTLDPFVLRGDKAHVFSSDGSAALGYRTVLGVGLASGDPVGDPRGFGGAVAAYVERCLRNGWRIGVLGVREETLPVFERAGLHSMHVGDEAVVDVRAFSLEGRRMRKVRQSAVHATRCGISTEVHREGDIDEALRAELLRIAVDWRNGASEHGFSMALDALMSGRDRDCVVIVARDAGGRPVAFQRFVPCRDGRALSLDAMRRLREAPGGINERMIVDVVEWAKADGVEDLSLNFAALRSIMLSTHLTWKQKVVRFLVRRLSFKVQIESLCRFNAKFHPRWVPRYLVYRSIADVPAVLAAILSAEGFLPFDRKRSELPHPQLDPA